MLVKFDKMYISVDNQSHKRFSLQMVARDLMNAQMVVRDLTNA